MAIHCSARRNASLIADFGIWVPDWGWDGAAIATGGWVVDNCEFARCNRGVEIYPAVGESAWTGKTRASVRNCKFTDVLYQAVTDGGAAALNQVDIQNNTMFNDLANLSVAGSNAWSYPGHGVAIVGGDGSPATRAPL